MEDARFEDASDGPLRLAVTTADDLSVVAALTQDGVVQTSDMSWMKRARQFAVLVNRFRWEDEAPVRASGRPVERVQSVLVFDSVFEVHSSGVDPEDKDLVLSLIGVAFEPGEDADGHVVLTFSGDGSIRLAVECLDARLKDVSQPYIARTQTVPSHPLD